MQLRRGQTPDSRSPPQHYCIFKPLSPCGNSQFDDADLQCWQASVTISFSQTKRDAVYNAFSWENSLIFMVTCTIAKRKLERESGWITKWPGDCVVGLQDYDCWNQNTFQISYNHYKSIQFNLNQFFRFRVWLISWKHSFQRNFGITAAAGNTSQTDVLKV